MRLDKVRIGPGTEPDSEMGPLITREHRDRVASYVEDASDPSGYSIDTSIPRGS